MIDTTIPRTTASASLLLPTQLVFNIGFYAVVPFLALVMTDELDLGAAAVGLVLGARTFSQQGMFLFGGAIADRWGPLRSILAGCVVRAAGYLGLATSDGFWTFLASAILTGIGGAFFSPAVEGLIGALDRARSMNGGRRNLFAWLVLFGEIGAVAGPLLGTALLPNGFPVVAGSAALLFFGVGIALWLLLPKHDSVLTVVGQLSGRSSTVSGAFTCLRDRRFVYFAAVFSVNLLAYNQLYFALPLELTQNGSGAGTLAVLFTLASVLTIALQIPLSAVAAKLGPAATLGAGFGCIAAGLAVMSLSSTTGLSLFPGLSVVTGPVAFVILLSLGHMLVGPAGMQLVHHFAGPRPLGAYYGLLATCGGVAVLIGNTLFGAVRDLSGGLSSWNLILILAIASAATLPHLLPGSHQKDHP